MEHTAAFGGVLRAIRIGGVLAGLAAFGAGCGKDGATPGGAGQAQGAATSAGSAEARKLWADRCVRCHGKKGEGNGPDSAALEPKPRNFTDASWQAGVTDEHLQKIIVDGGMAVGKSPLMPPNPDLKDKAEVVAALKDIVRSLQK